MSVVTVAEKLGVVLIAVTGSFFPFLNVVLVIILFNSYLAVFHLSLSPGPPKLAVLPAGQGILCLTNCKSMKIHFQFF